MVMDLIPKHSTLLSTIWSLWANAKGRVCAAFVAMAVSSAMLLAIGWGLKCVIDRGFSDKSGVMLDQALIGMFALVLLLALAGYTRQILMNTLAEKSVATLRSRIFSNLLNQDAYYFDRHQTGDLMARINADTTILQILMTSQLPTFLRHSLMVIGGIGMLCVVSPWMTVILLMSIPFILGPVIFFGRRVRTKSRSTQDSLGVMASFGLERLQGIKTLQSFAHEKETSVYFDRLVNDTMLKALSQVKARAFMTSIVVFIAFSAVGVVLWSGGQKVLAGDMTAGDLSAFIFYAATLAGSLMNLSEVGGEFQRAAGAADRLNQVLNEKVSLKGNGVMLPSDKIWQGAVSFQGVDFFYPSRDHHGVSGLDFVIPAGKMTAIVGPSGAGKSTIFHLLQRFYDIKSGAILIDGVDISTIDPREVRKLMAVVSQDPVLFSMSVEDNIRLAKPDATRDEIEAAAKLAQADSFIAALPHGYDTQVGERGSQLSGGQKQRIAIARAFLKGAKILLLDEATSALDAQNEQAVYDALQTLSKGRTTIVIAHKLSTIHSADQILVIDHGRLQASGTHDSLSASNDIYRRMSFLKVS